MKNILVLIDVQKEYTTQGRPFYLNGIEPSLAKCQNLLKSARKFGWDIIHVQHSNGNEASRFNPSSNYFEFVDGFEPYEDEKLFIKTDFSCYSSAEYTEHMERMVKSVDDCNIYIVGYNSVMCCLSTLEEARRKGHKLIYIEDASYAKALDGRTEVETHKFMLDLYRAKNLAKITNYLSVMEEAFSASYLYNNLFNSVSESNNEISKKMSIIHKK